MNFTLINSFDYFIKYFKEIITKFTQLILAFINNIFSVLDYINVVITVEFFSVLW